MSSRVVGAVAAGHGPGSGKSLLGLSRFQPALWMGEKPVSIGWILICGALIWAAYGVINALINGIFVDEAVVSAGVINGTTTYPPGHPSQIFYPKAFSLLSYLSAAIWAIDANLVVLSALRNFLFIFLSAFVPFGITVLLTRRLSWGLLAGILVMTETAFRFGGTYPIYIFPTFYSHGHIGIHLALLAVVFVLAGSARFGGGLLGMLPALHPAMAIIIWPWAAVCFVLRNHIGGGGKSSGRPREFIKWALPIGLGLTVCLVLAIIILLKSSGADVVPPYDTQEANSELFLSKFLEFDGHRKLFDIRTFGYLVNPLAFFIIVGILFRRMKDHQPDSADYVCRRNLTWILALGAMIWVGIYALGLFKLLIGPLPLLVEISLPFRFSNITGMLLIPVTVAGMAWAQKTMSPEARTISMILITGLVLLTGIYMLLGGDSLRFLAPLLRGSVGVRYLIFSVWGLLFSLEMFSGGRRLVDGLATLAMVGALAGVLLLVSPDSRVATSFLASFLLASAALAIGPKALQFTRLNFQSWSSALGMTMIAACVLVGVGTLVHVQVLDKLHAIQGENNYDLGRWDVVSEYDQELDRWLKANADPNEMILPAFLSQPREIQAKTGQPVLMDLGTLATIYYNPRLAPQVKILMGDLYGIDYANSDQVAMIGGSSYFEIAAETWNERTLQKWQALGQKYGFRLVVAPAGSTLDLPVVLSNPAWTLHAIPSRTES